MPVVHKGRLTVPCYWYRFGSSSVLLYRRQYGRARGSHVWVWATNTTNTANTTAAADTAVTTCTHTWRTAAVQHVSRVYGLLAGSDCGVL